MKKILIVDDNERCRECCQMLLAEYKFVTVLVPGAQEALEILDNTFDLVITDFNMPGFDGMWLAKQIQNKFYGKVPVIMMTGSINNVSIFTARGLGIVDFLLKPVNIDYFLTTVYRYVK